MKDSAIGKAIRSRKTASSDELFIYPKSKAGGRHTGLVYRPPVFVALNEVIVIVVLMRVRHSVHLFSFSPEIPNYNVYTLAKKPLPC